MFVAACEQENEKERKWDVSVVGEPFANILIRIGNWLAVMDKSLR